ncbi:MAG TPA: hypothetical protein VFQ51_19495 [Vicinamibacteria bacterium]|nr:hypothetical protein [Vicinamibacteria bacterium]
MRISRAQPGPMLTAALALVLGLAQGPTTGAAGEVDRRQQYDRLAEGPRAPPAELEAALLSPAGVEDIAVLFESSLAAPLVVGGTPVTPELGGEATLDAGRLRFVTYPDPVHPVIRRMVALADDPASMLAFLSASSEGQRVLAGAGGLHALLHQMTTEPPTPARRRAMDEVLQGAVERFFKTWTVTPEVQLEAIGRHDWRGRYVGFWHLHPPRITSDGYAPGLEPSAEDLSIAMETGQLLTLVFQPDGFDAYDLAAVSAAGTAALSQARVVRHRSDAWKQRFERPRTGSSPPAVRLQRQQTSVTVQRLQEPVEGPVADLPA